MITRVSCLLLFLFGLSIPALFSQDQNDPLFSSPGNELQCGNHILWAKEKENNSKFYQQQQQLDSLIYRYLTDNNQPKNQGQEKTIYTIPVVVHIIHENGGENISDEQVITGIEQLNDAFANTGYYDQGSGANIEVNFCLAKQDPDENPTNGITRNVSSLTNLDASTQNLALKNISRWDPTCYLNIWVVKSIYFSFSGTLAAGYAYLPSAHGEDYDGIVIWTKAIGLSEAFTSTLAHEVGHYLGLYHTFHGGCDNNNCYFDGDRVCDTPPDQSTSYVPCASEVNTCTTDTNSGLTSDLPDDTHNYLDYQFKDCRHDFTEGQKERMRFFLTGVRSSLLNCSSCLDPCPITLDLDIGLQDTLFIPVGVNYTVSPVNNQNINQIDWYLDGEWISNGLSFQHQFTEVGVFQLSAIGTSNHPDCLGISDAIMVRTYCLIPPEIDILADTLEVTYGQDTQIEVTQLNIQQAIWSINGEVVGNTVDHTFNFTAFSQFYLDLTVYNEYEACSDYDRVYIIIKCPNPPEINILTDTLEVTYGQDTQIEVTQLNIHQAIWSINGEVVGNTVDHIFNFTAYGQFYLDITIYNEYPECSDYDRVLIIVKCPIDASFTTSQQTASVGDTLTFTANNVNALSYKWYINNEQVGSSSTLEAGFPNSGTFSIVLVVEEAFCERASEHFWLVVEDPCSYEDQELQLLNYDFGLINWVERNEDGNYIILDRTHGIAVLDENFNRIWATNHSIEGFQSEKLILFEAVQDTVNGGFVIVGLEKYDDFFVVFKLSESGELLWSKKIHVPDVPNKSASSITIQRALDGDFIVTGNTSNLDLPSSSQTTSFILKIDEQGNQVWLRNYGGTKFQDLIVLEDGCYLIYGWISPSTPATILKVDSNGYLEWAKSYYIGNYNIISVSNQIKPTEDNGYIFHFTIAVQGEHLTPYFAKINATGDIVFCKQLIDNDEDDDLWMNGISTALNSDFLFTINLQNNGIIGRVSNEGDILWLNKYPYGPVLTEIKNFEPGKVTVFGWGFISVHDEQGEQDGCGLLPVNYSFNEIPVQVETLNIYPIAAYHHYDNFTSLTIEEYNPLPNQIFCTSTGLSAFDAKLELTGLQTCGDSILLSYNVCNLGNQPILAQTPMTFYPQDPTKENTTAFFTKPIGNNIQPDSCSQLKMIIPYTETMDIFAIINDNGTIDPTFDLGNDFPVTEDYECNFFNNLATISLEELVDLPPLDWNPVADAILCPADTLNLVASEGFDHYLWQDGSTDHHYSAAGPGIYTVEASTFCGEIRKDSIHITAPEVPNLDLGPNLESCQSQVVALLAQSGFTHYLWQDGWIFPDYTATDPGTYWVTATDECGETQSDTIVISVIPGLSFDLGEGMTICPGDSVQINVVANYTTYQWYPEEGVNCATCPETAIKPEATTKYFLIASDEAECLSSDTLTITVLPTYFIEETVSICAGESIELFGNSVSEAGIYPYTYTSAVGCDSTVQITLEVLPNSETQEVLNICEGEEIDIFGEFISQEGLYHQSYIAANGCDSTHFIQLNVMPIIYTFENIFPCIGETLMLFGEEVTESGSYDATFTGITHCDSIHTVTVEFVDEVNTQEVITICLGETATLFGEETFMAGNYSASFLSLAGCDSTHLVELIVLDTTSSESFHTICEGEALEIFGESFTATGTYAAIFSAENGCDSSHYAHLEVLPMATSFEAISICQGEEAPIFGQMEHLAGEYIQVFEAANGCDSVATINLVVNDSLVFDQSYSHSCSESPTGNIQLTPITGEMPLSYSWAHSEENISSFYNLEAGPYSVTITDQNQCTTTLDWSIENIPFPDYEIMTQAVSCFGENDGILELMSNDTALEISLNGAEFSNTYFFVSLASGQHQVIIRQADGCESMETIEINSPPAIVIESIEIIQPTCDNLADGWIQVASSGGIGDLLYEWENGNSGNQQEELSAGSYDLTITDENQCQLMTTIDLEAVSAMTSNVSISYGCGDGQIIVSAFPEGGIAPYDLTWDNDQTGNYLVNLTAGNYMLTVTDGQGCEIIETITVNYVAPFQADYSSQDVTCPGGNDGQIDLNVTGGTPPYSFFWNTGTSTEDLSNLSSGYYQVNIYSGECSIAENILIQEPEPFDINLTYSPGSGNLVEASVAVSGGTPPYFYDWSNGTSGTTTGNLVESTEYFITVTDAENCYAIAPFIPIITATEQIDQQHLVKVFPVPTSGVLRYTLSEGAEILPYDLHLVTPKGKTVLKMANLSVEQNQIDLSQLPSGVYFLTLVNQNYLLIRKVVKVD